jgi:glutamine synthetase
LRLHSEARSETNTAFLVGFESEFVLLRRGPDGEPTVQPVNRAPWSGTRGLLAGTPEAAALEEMVQSLLAMGIHVEQYHTEGAAGQYEIVTAPLPPVEAADALMRTRETIRNVAAKHGLHATFAPRPYGEDCAFRSVFAYSLHV